MVILRGSEYSKTITLSFNSLTDGTLKSYFQFYNKVSVDLSHTDPVEVGRSSICPVLQNSIRGRCDGAHQLFMNVCVTLGLKRGDNLVFY